MYYHRKKVEFSQEEALATEWLETNDLGSYASSSVASCHTRKYHGLLVAKFDKLADKYVILNKLEDVLVCGGKEYCLSSHLYPGFFQDGGIANLYEFRLGNRPIWTFKFADLTILKEIILLSGKNALLIKYTVTGGTNWKLNLRPLLSCRSFHKLQRESHGLIYNCSGTNDGFCCAPSGDTAKVIFRSNAKHGFLSEPLWYRNFVYIKEKERGYDYEEDLYSPGVMIFDGAYENEIILGCFLNDEQEINLSDEWRRELARRDKFALLLNAGTNKLYKQLQEVAPSFITRKATSSTTRSVVAGYHWFLEWGRDAMISLPGLTLHDDRENIYLAVLKNFLVHQSQGLIPNYLGCSEESNAYNSVDTSLWFIWAVQQYYLRTGNFKEVIASFWQVMRDIFAFYKLGTLNNIKMQDDGLLYAGSADLNLTWMDAVVDGKPVTPRYGYQVEVNALWFNALSFIYELACKLEDEIQYELKQLLPQIKASYLKTFWCEEKGYLYDFVNAEQKNSALRPNQIFAVSLPYSPLLITAAVKIVNQVREHLLTPYGLRTLASFESGYVGFYGGDQAKRDSAYHNGTVWPWLIGHFTEALLKVTSDKSKVVAIITPCFEALQNHLSEYGIGSIAEVFSGDFPHRPEGCISQAWSVAEVSRAINLLGIDK